MPKEKLNRKASRLTKIEVKQKCECSLQNGSVVVGLNVFETDHHWCQLPLSPYAIGLKLQGKERIEQKAKTDYSNQVVRCRWRKKGSENGDEIS